MEDNDKLPSNKAPNIIQSREEVNNSSEGEVQTRTFGGQDYSNPYAGNNSFSRTESSYSEGSTIKHPVGVSQQPVSRANVYKVYIGSYSTLEQARVAQNIIQDANLGVTSFVKTSSSGAYTIQVGSYTDQAKATALANELKRNHFPARMVQE